MSTFAKCFLIAFVYIFLSMPYKVCSFSGFLSNSWDNSTGELYGWDSDMRRLDKDGRFHLGNVCSVVNRTTALIFTLKRFVWTAVARETRRQIIVCYCDCFVKKKSASLLANFSVKLSDLISTEYTMLLRAPMCPCSWENQWPRKTWDAAVKERVWVWECVWEGVCEPPVLWFHYIMLWLYNVVDGGWAGLSHVVDLGSQVFLPRLWVSVFAK